MSSQNRNGNSKPTANAATLLQNAHLEGNVSDASLQALNGVDLGAQIQAGLGVCVDDVEASEVLLLTILVDDSSSISSAQATATVRAGYNLVIDALNASKQKDGVLVHTRYLNGNVLCPYRPIEGAPLMDNRNYQPNGGTPLYDQCVVALGAVLAKVQEFTDAGVVARSVTLVITDGADMHSTRAASRDVAALVRDVTRQEGHIVAAMGIADGSTDFRAVFRDMGIADAWILTPGSGQADIRRAFQVFSQSAVRASQSTRFSASGGMGGFMN